jgi:hypothetical protein
VTITLPAAPTLSTWQRVRSTARTHRVFLVLLGMAGLLRLLIMEAYHPAFWYDGDSGSYLGASARPLTPTAQLANGYVIFLKVLRFTGLTTSISYLQHLLGLGIAVGVYALLQRRGVARWISCLVVTPLLFDSLVLTIEHHILVETLYTALICAAVGVLLWRPRPTVRVAVVSGVLLAAAWFVKPLALPLVVVLAGYLVLRRTGWRTWTAFLLTFAVGYLGVMIWVDGRASPYGANNIAFYSRVAGFAHCDTLVLTDQERTLCPAPDILGHRPDWYAWVSQSPGYPYRQTRSGDPILRDFAIAVVSQQPGDYVRAVSREVEAHFVDGVELGPEFDCLNGRYSMPADVRVEGGGDCHPQMAAPYFTSARVDPKFLPGPTPLTQTLSSYSGAAHTPRLAVTGVFVLVLVSLLFRGRWRRRQIMNGSRVEMAGRRGSEALVADAVMLAVVSLAIIVLPVLVGMYEPRYALPALPFLAVAAGFAARSLSLGFRRPRPVAPPAVPVSFPAGPVDPVVVGSAPVPPVPAEPADPLPAEPVDPPEPSDPAEPPGDPDDIRGARATNMRVRWAFWTGAVHRSTGNRRRGRAGRTNAARTG